MVWPLVEAISRRLICTVTYQSPEKSAPTTFRLLPLKLVVHNGSLYLHAWQPRFDSVFLLNLQRLKSLKVTNEQGAVPKSYNPAALEQSAFGIFIGKDVEKFKLRFSSKAKPWIEERQWHPSQTCTSLRDGGCMLTFTCTPSYEVTGWVLSWRDQVEVLAPESLKDELKKYGQWLGRQYA